MTLDLETAGVSLTFNEVQGLRDLEDRTLSLSGHCKSALCVTQRLQKVPGAGFEYPWVLEPYSDRLSDFMESLSALTARINNTIDLVRQNILRLAKANFDVDHTQAAYFLELRNQETAAATNRAMSELASKTNKDTTSVKWITYVTLIYLPATFVAVSRPSSCRFKAIG